MIILLDSNASSNTRSTRALRSQLIKQGAEVLIAKLPVIAGVNGPDDYIGVAGDDAMATVLTHLAQEPTETLWTASDRRSAMLGPSWSWVVTLSSFISGPRSFRLCLCRSALRNRSCCQPGIRSTCFGTSITAAPPVLRPSKLLKTRSVFSPAAHCSRALSNKCSCASQNATERLIWI